MRVERKVHVIAAVTLIASAAAAADEAVKADTDRPSKWILSLCYADGRSKATDEKWLANATLANQRFAGLLPGAPEAAVSVQRCPEDYAEQCVARLGKLQCREDSITRSLQAVALMAAAIASSGNSDASSQLARGSPLSPSIAMGIAEGLHGRAELLPTFKDAVISRKLLSKSELERALRLYTELRGEDERSARQKAQRTSNAHLPLSRATALYGQASRLLMAFILGHEAYHYHGDRCPLEDAAAAEKSGLYSGYVRSQASAEYFCEGHGGSARPSVRELKADTCALRFVEAQNRMLGTGTDQTLARRIALDVASWFVVHAGLPSVVYAEGTRWTPRFAGDYLWPPLRLMVLRESLAAGDDKTAWAIGPCGDTAQLVTTVIQTLASQCKRDEVNLPDAVTDRLPRGVITAWETGQWGASSFDCKPPP